MDSRHSASADSVEMALIVTPVSQTRACEQVMEEYCAVLCLYLYLELEYYEEVGECLPYDINIIYVYYHIRI